MKKVNSVRVYPDQLIKYRQTTKIFTIFAPHLPSTYAEYSGF